MGYIAYKFRDGSTTVARRKPKEIWEFMTQRVLVKKFGPVTVDNGHHHLKGYVCGNEMATAQQAKADVQNLIVKPY